MDRITPRWTSGWAMWSIGGWYCSIVPTIRMGLESSRCRSLAMRAVRWDAADGRYVVWSF